MPVQSAQVDFDHARREPDRRLLNEQVVAPDLGLQHRHCLREGMAGVRCWSVRPEQLDHAVATEPAARVDGQPDQQGEVLARAELDLLTSSGEQERCPKRGKVQMRRHRDGSRCFGMLLIGPPVNGRSTTCRDVEGSDLASGLESDAREVAVPEAARPVAAEWRASAQGNQRVRGAGRALAETEEARGRWQQHPKVDALSAWRWRRPPDRGP